MDRPFVTKHFTLAFYVGDTPQRLADEKLQLACISFHNAMHETNNCSPEDYDIVLQWQNHIDELHSLTSIRNDPDQIARSIRYRMKSSPRSPVLAFKRSSAVCLEDLGLSLVPGLYIRLIDCRADPRKGKKAFSGCEITQGKEA